MRDPQLISIEYEVAQMSRRLISKCDSYDQYVNLFSNEIYFEVKRRSKVEQELLIDTASKHGFDADEIKQNMYSAMKSGLNHKKNRTGLALQQASSN